MKNKLIDVNNLMMAQLERLGDEGLTAENLELELDRSKAMVSVSNQLVGIASVALQGAKFKAEYALKDHDLPEMLEVNPTKRIGA